MISSFHNHDEHINAWIIKEVLCHPFKGNILGTGQKKSKQTRYLKCQINESKTGSIFFKQSLNVMCGRTSQNDNYLSSKCVGVTAERGTWQAHQRNYITQQSCRGRSRGDDISPFGEESHLSWQTTAGRGGKSSTKHSSPAWNEGQDHFVAHNV